MPLSKNKLVWMDREIEIAATWQKSPLPVMASCLGPVAVHPAQNKTMPLKPGVRKWSLTHIPSGKAILHSNERKDLEKIAFILAYRYGHAFRLQTHEEIKNLLPPAIYEWLRACYQKGAWIEPPTPSTPGE